VIFGQAVCFGGPWENFGFVSGYRGADGKARFAMSAANLATAHFRSLPLHTFPIPFRLLIPISYDPSSSMQS
jgi:hypothetical protein